MLVEEFINKFENDIEFKNNIIKELKNKKSIFSEKEILEHKEQLKNLYYNLTMSKLFDTLEEYSLLEENWDGYGADKPNQKIINNAREFLKLLMTKIEFFPKSMIGSLGTVAFYFSVDKENYIEIEIEEDNYFYFVKNNIQGIFGKEDLKLDKIDSNLIESINLIHKKGIK